MAGPLASALGRILNAAGAGAGAGAGASTSGSPASRVITGVGQANARSYSRMLAGEIATAFSSREQKRSTQRQQDKQETIARRGAAERLYLETFLPSVAGAAIGAGRAGKAGARITPWLFTAGAAGGRVAGGAAAGGAAAGGAAAGGGGMAAGALAAASANPVGAFMAAIGIWVGVGKFIASASKNLAEGARTYGEWNASTAIGVLVLDLGRMSRTIRQANDLQASNVKLLRARNRLEEAWQPYETTIKKWWTEGITFATNNISNALEGLEFALSGFSAEKLKEIMARGGAPPWSPLGRAWMEQAYPIGYMATEKYLASAWTPANKAPGE